MEETSPGLIHHDEGRQLVTGAAAPAPAVPGPAPTAVQTQGTWRSELKAILGLAVPTIVQTTAQQAMIVTDNIFVGHLGTNELAAAALGNMYNSFLTFFLLGTATALDTLGATAHGAAKTKVPGATSLASWTATSALVVTALCIPALACLSVAQYFASGVLRQDEEISHMVGEFCRGLMLGVYPMIWSTILMKYLQVQGVVVAPAIITAMTFALNIGANFAFIDAAGFQGAPFATSFSQWAQFLGLSVLVTVFVITRTARAARWQQRHKPHPGLPLQHSAALPYSLQGDAGQLQLPEMPQGRQQVYVGGREAAGAGLQQDGPRQGKEMQQPQDGGQQQHLVQLVVQLPAHQPVLLPQPQLQLQQPREQQWHLLCEQQQQQQQQGAGAHTGRYSSQVDLGQGPLMMTCNPMYTANGSTADGLVGSGRHTEGGCHTAYDSTAGDVDGEARLQMTCSAAWQGGLQAHDRQGADTECPQQRERHACQCLQQCQCIDSNAAMNSKLHTSIRQRLKGLGWRVLDLVFAGEERSGLETPSDANPTSQGAINSICSSRSSSNGALAQGASVHLQVCSAHTTTDINSCTSSSSLSGTDALQQGQAESDTTPSSRAGEPREPQPDHDVGMRAHMQEPLGALSSHAGAAPVCIHIHSVATASPVVRQEPASASEQAACSIQSTTANSRQRSKDSAKGCGATSCSTQTHSRSAGPMQHLAQDVIAALKSGATRQHILTYLKLGIPGGIMMCFEFASFEVHTSLAAQLGPTVTAAHSALLNIITLTYISVPFAVGIAASIRVGNLLGAGLHHTARRASRMGLAVGISFMLCCAIAMLSARHHIGAIFSSDPDVIAVVATIVPMAALFQVSDGVLGPSQGVLRGCGKQTRLMVYTLVGFWGCGVLLGALLCFKAGLGVQGLWWGIASGDISTALMTLLSMLRLDWPHEAKVAQQRLQTGSSPDAAAPADNSVADAATSTAAAHDDAAARNADSQ